MVYKIKVYETKDNKHPFNSWLEKLDIPVQAKIQVRLRRAGLGNFGDWKFVVDGINEFRLDFGPGYRIYYNNIDLETVLILCAGTKRTQTKDIQIAKDYLKDFKARGKSSGKK
jgi:putative addiction module killer protein